MEIDGRRLSRQRQQEIRVEAVRRVHAREKPSDVAYSIGFSTSRIFGWLAEYRAGGMR